MKAYLTIKYICFNFWLLLLLASTVSAAEKNSAWQDYEQAVNLYRYGGATDKILKLCKSVRKNAGDPVLQARAAFLSVQVYNAENNFHKAGELLADLYNPADKFPKTISAEARLRHANILHKMLQPERAQQLFITVCDSAPNIFYAREAQLGLANLFANTGSWQKSDSVLTALVAVMPNYKNDERVRILTARQALSLGNPQQAIGQLQGKQSEASLVLLAQAYEKAGKSIMAVGVYKKICDRYPGTIAAENALFQAGEVFMRAEDWLAARNEFKKLLQNYPQSSRKTSVQFRLGWIYLQLKQYDKALAAFQVRLSDPGQASYFAFMRAECLYRMGLTAPEKLQEAVLAFNGLAALYSKSTVAPPAKLRAALILFERGAAADAVISLRQFLSLYPKDELGATAIFLLATRGEPGMAGYYFNSLIEKYQRSALFDVALTALQVKDYRKEKYQEIINRQAHLGLEKIKSGNPFWLRAQALLHAESSYYLQHYEQALRDYDQAIGGSEDEIAQNAKLGKAWCLLQQGFVDSARVRFVKLEKNLAGPAFAKAAYGLATCYFRQKEYEKALQVYPANLADEGNGELQALIAKSLFRSAECYFRLEYYGQAIEIWLQLAQNYPQHKLAAKSLYRAADTYFRANHFDKAETTYTQILQNYNSSSFAAESMLQLAQCKYNSGDYQAAVSGFEKFIKKYPRHRKSKDALEGIQLGYYQMGQSELASGTLEKVIEEFPDGMLSADARYRLASSYLAGGNFTKAIEAFKEILTQFPGTSYAMDAQFALAGAYQAQGKNEMANAEYQRFIQYFPDSPNIAEATFNLAIGYFNLESYLSASDFFNQIAEKHQHSSFYLPALQNLGWCYKKLGENEKALQYFQLFVDKNAAGPEQDQMRLQIATMKAELGLEAEAMPVFLALSKNSDGEIAAEAAYQRAMLLLKNENIELARRAFNLAIKKGAADNFYRLSALAQLGAIYEGRKNWKKAVAAYKLLADSASDPTWVAAAQERMQAIVSRISAE